MIVFDADILSYFSKLNRLHLLVETFTAPLLISPNVQRELQAGSQLGYKGLQPALELIQAGTLQVLTMTDAAHALVPQVSIAPDKGDTDSLAYCLAHDIVFVTNDRRAYRLGCKLGIQCFRLPTLLRLLWTRGPLHQADVRDLITEIEARLHFVVSNQERIFADASN